MVSHLFRVMYGLPENAILGFDNFHNLNPSVPRIFFTHDNYIKDFTGDFETKQPFYDKTVVLLARDPRDVAVSQFFQWKFRIKPSKVAINNYPPQGSDISLFDFVMGDNGGALFQEMQKALFGTNYQLAGVYAGLGGRDVPHSTIEKIIDNAQRNDDEITWIDI